MANLNIAVKAKNTKCFGAEEQGFDSIYPINLIIGKNNSGKSALLDLIQHAIKPGSVNLVRHKDNNPEILLTKPFPEHEIKRTFSESTSSGGVPGKNFYEFGMQSLNKPLTIRLTNTSKDFVKLDPPLALPPNIESQHHFYTTMGQNFGNPLEGKVFKKLAAERNITPEVNNANPLLTEDGGGASNVIQKFITRAAMGNRDMVERDLLMALNSIFSPEAKFTRILVQQLDDERWEIYLEEENKGRIALSNSGSGLKTVILVLINILLIPKLQGSTLGHFVFAMEELENNLHPALQRKLLLYIRDIAIKHNCIFFLTTHSNVIIDLFGNDPEAQIIHVKNDGTCATARRVQTHLDNAGVLDDLDFRASDILQSNGVVWLEGPSDRVYFNRWVELWSDGQLKEGVHYQCLFYGGKLLAHFSASAPVDTGEVPILKINKNCILLMDSDKHSERGKINQTKERIKAEIESIQGLSWITKCKEVENYIPTQAIVKYYSVNNASPLQPYEEFSDYLEKIKQGEGKKFLRNKVVFSEVVAPLITKDMFADRVNFKKTMDEVCDRIKTWNKLT